VISAAQLYQRRAIKMRNTKEKEIVCAIIDRIEQQKGRKLSGDEELLVVNTAFFIFREWDLYYRKVTA
jgi:hypothetical protein